MKKSMTRLICLSLAILMLMPLLFACKKENVEGEGTGAAATEAVVSDVETQGANSEETTAKVIETDENGFQKDALGKQDLGGKEIRILAWDGGVPYHEFNMDFEEIDKYVLGQEVYNRNTKVQVRMNIKLSFTRVSGYNGTYNSEYLPKAEAMITENSVDSFACYSMASTPLMVRGYLKDLSAFPVLDFNAPWWSQDLIERASLYDRLYFASGSISPSLLGQSWAMFFNKSMADIYLSEKLTEMGATTVYDLVDEGKWTLDNFMTLAKSVTIAGTEKTADETYGFVTDHVAYDPFFFGADLRTLDNAADGSLQVSDAFGSAKTIELCDKLLNFFRTNSVGAAYDRSVGGTKYTFTVNSAWHKGNALFSNQCLGNLATQKQNSAVGEDGIGVLPMPKWNEDQEKYVSTAGFPFTLWCIARASDRQQATATTIECLASEAYRLTEPALYEEVLKIQSTDGEGSANDRRMIDLVRDTIVIDAGRLHNDQIHSLGWGMFRNSLMDDQVNSAANSGYATFFAANLAKLEGDLQKINSSVYTFESVYGD